KVIKCVDIVKAKKLEDYVLILTDPGHDNNQNQMQYSLKDLIIKPQRIYLAISKDLHFRKSEVRILNWLKDNHILIYMYLKKPVNNLEVGYIQNFDINYEETKKKSGNKTIKNHNYISLQNIFGSEINIPYDKVESISFRYNSVMIQIKSATSFSSRLGYKLLKKFKPERIILT
ncbi:MAG: hypothetical protein ACFE8B_16655, partial [Candidatus Hermodarchaeota archaeon]